MGIWKVMHMGIYLNPNNEDYEMMFNSDIFVDKSLMINISIESLIKAIAIYVYHDQEDSEKARMRIC